ncbi:hypothetical protein ACOSQ2_005152 [Xanthoceras sorbifolium]
MITRFFLNLLWCNVMLAETENFVQPAIPRFDGHYDHWSMLMENFLRRTEAKGLKGKELSFSGN